MKILVTQTDPVRGSVRRPTDFTTNITGRPHHGPFLQLILRLCFLALIAPLGCSSPKSQSSGHAVDAAPPLAKSNPAPTNSVLAIYDRAMVDSISHRWYSMIDEAMPSEDWNTGKVVMRFKLFPRGNIDRLTTFQSTANQHAAFICRKAIFESAPFPVWSDKMRAILTNNFRNIEFTFYYDHQKASTNQPVKATPGADVSNQHPRTRSTAEAR